MVSLDTVGKYAIQFLAEVTILGVTAEATVFVTDKGVDFYIQGDIWGLFLAKMTVHAENVGTWYDISLGVKGELLAVVDCNGNFQDSYLSALHRFVKFISDEAEKRINQVNNTLISAQHGLTR